MPNQPTPAQLIAAIVAADDRPLYRIESDAGIAHGAIRAWMDNRQCPRTAGLIAVANACGYRVVLVKDE